MVTNFMLGASSRWSFGPNSTCDMGRIPCDMGQYRDDDRRDSALHFIGEPQGKLVIYEHLPDRQKFDQAKANQETIWSNRLETEHLH